MNVYILTFQYSGGWWGILLNTLNAIWSLQVAIRKLFNCSRFLEHTRLILCDWISEPGVIYKAFQKFWNTFRKDSYSFHRITALQCSLSRIFWLQCSSHFVKILSWKSLKCRYLGSYSQRPLFLKQQLLLVYFLCGINNNISTEKVGSTYLPYAFELINYISNMI